MDAGLVYQHASSPPTYVFKHALLQDAAYQSLLKKTRRQLHARIVEVLREHFPERVGAQSEMVARHAEAAGLADDAIALYVRAAEQAAARSAHEEALLHLHRAIAVLATAGASVERDRREAGLQRALAAELIAARGYGHPETAAAWERMRAVSQAAGEQQSYGAALLGLALVEYASAQFDRASELIDEGLAVAERAGDAVHMVAAYNEKTTVAYFQGRFRSALEHAERGIALYEPERHHRVLVSLLGDDAGVAARATSGWALFQLGYPDRALARTAEAVRLAVSLDHSFSIAQTRMWHLCLHMERGDDVMGELAAELLRFSETQGFPLWAGAGKALLGYANGDPAMLLEGSAMAARTGNQASAPTMFFFLADAYRRRGLFADALATVEAGLATAAAISVPFYDANLYRLRGDIILADGVQSMSESRRIAEECFRRAIEIARGQEAKCFELRAVNSLVRLLCAQGRHGEARALLAPLYAWFREGFDTRYLLEAKALLAELGT
jgi:tetratricopeptide (TPR) repeat protein